MHPETILDLWAPAVAPWSLWARPNLFAQMSASGETIGERPWLSTDVSWAPDARQKCVLMIDLPGAEAVWVGLALTGRGYRPVPVYEVCTGPHELLDQGPIIEALRAGAAYLATLSLAPVAPPAFLVDAARMRPPGRARPGAFDNRWKVGPFDFPSSPFLTARGLGRVLLVQRGRLAPQEDLARTLRAWEEAGIAVAAKDIAGNRPARGISVLRPPWPQTVWDRVLKLLGLRCPSADSFGITT